MSPRPRAADWRVAKPPEMILTRREWEILDLVRRGLSNIEIGRVLGISRITVRNHLTNVYDKLNVGNRQQAVARAFNLPPPTDLPPRPGQPGSGDQSSRPTVEGRPSRAG